LLPSGCCETQILGPGLRLEKDLSGFIQEKVWAEWERLNLPSTMPLTLPALMELLGRGLTKDTVKAALKRNNGGVHEGFHVVERRKRNPREEMFWPAGNDSTGITFIYVFRRSEEGR
jgi:hypothetical protein